MCGILSYIARWLSSWEPDPAVLQWLTHDPILAELGIIDAGKFRTAIEVRGFAPRHRDFMGAVIQQTLEVEAWLKHRSGRLWRATQDASVTRQQKSVATVAH
jgi:hypothetical protein